MLIYTKEAHVKPCVVHVTTSEHQVLQAYGLSMQCCPPICAHYKKGRITQGLILKYDNTRVAYFAGGSRN